MSFMSLWGTVNNIASIALGGTRQRKQFIMSCGEEKLTLPVTPNKYNVKTTQLNKVVDIIDFLFSACIVSVKVRLLRQSRRSVVRRYLTSDGLSGIVIVLVCHFFILLLFVSDLMRDKRVPFLSWFEQRSWPDGWHPANAIPITFT